MNKVALQALILMHQQVLSLNDIAHETANGINDKIINFLSDSIFVIFLIKYCILCRFQCGAIE